MARRGGFVQCFARGTPGNWEAICVDLDIAVQGSSYDEVRGLLDTALASYIADAQAESPDQARRLLRRRAPFYVTMGLALSYLWHATFRSASKELRAGFDLPCPA